MSMTWWTMGLPGTDRHVIECHSTHEMRFKMMSNCSDAAGSMWWSLGGGAHSGGGGAGGGGGGGGRRRARLALHQGGVLHL